MGDVANGQDRGVDLWPTLIESLLIFVFGCGQTHGAFVSGLCLGKADGIVGMVPFHVERIHRGALRRAEAPAARSDLVQPQETASAFSRNQRYSGVLI